MGRPIKKKFFANLNDPYQNQATGGTTGVGGESLASVEIATTGTLYASTATATVSAPQVAGGVRATVTVAISTVTGGVSVVSFTPGSGYTSTPTVTVSPATTGTTATFTVSLTTTRNNGLAVTAFIPGGSSAVAGDIMKQESSRRYLVNTAQGQGQCRLTAADDASLTEGQMNLIATDVNGSTYYVTKLTARRAYLSTATMSTSFEYEEGTAARWSLAAASTGTVSLANN